MPRRCRELEPTQRPKCSASAPTPCAAGSAVTATRSPSARSATTATTSWWSCRRCATRSPRPATSPRRSSWPASARPRRASGGSMVAALRELRRGRRRPRDRGELGAAAAGAHGRGVAAAGDRRARRRSRPRGRAGIRLALGNGLAARRPPPRLRRPRARQASSCSTPAMARMPRRFTPRRSTSLCAAPASASWSSPTSSATSVSSAPSRALDPTAIVLCGPGADTAERRPARPQDPRDRLRRTALRLPRQRPDRRRRSLRRREPQPSDRHAQRGPAPPRRPGFRLGGIKNRHKARGPCTGLTWLRLPPPDEPFRAS